MSHQNNVERIKTVFQSLGELQNEVVFVGGATVSLYADQETFEVRETDDVDVIIEVLNYADHVKFEEQLRKKGFTDDTGSKVRGRFKIQNIKVDIMPTTDVFMGFENKWYSEGFEQAIHFELNKNIGIKILTATYFLGTKLEAFKNRGYSDPRQSHDFEDVVFILENRRTIWNEMSNAAQNLKGYFVEEFKKLLASGDIYEWIDCHVAPGSPPSTNWIVDELEKFCETKS
jgi:predicted nucleotidyltransferase